MDQARYSGYLAAGPFTDPGRYSTLLSRIVERVGPEPAALAGAVRDLMVHVYWREAYGLPKDEARTNAETRLRRLEERLARLTELARESGLDPAGPLPLGNRVIGNCRDFSLFFTALLRRTGVPARCRCGFATYFLPDHFEDHWIVERWDESRKLWIASDPQLDTTMIEKCRVSFDPLELPPGAFVSGGAAWLACRAGADSSKYGIFELSGIDFVKGDFILDLHALAARELLPWDFWGLMGKPFKELSPAELELLDRLAPDALLGADLDPGEATSLVSDPRLGLPRRIMSWEQNAAITVDLGEDAALTT